MRQGFREGISEGRQTTLWADQASYYMLQLYRTNLEVRLQCIDQETLSAHQKQIYSRIAERLQVPVRDWETDAALEWDETYKLERMIALLFNGAQLRQEVAHTLTELADKNVPEAASFAHEHQAIAGTPAQDGQPPPEMTACCGPFSCA